MKRKAALDGLLADPRLLVIGLRGTWLAEQVVASGRAITLIEPYTDAEAHRQIAEQELNLLPP